MATDDDDEEEPKELPAPEIAQIEIWAKEYDRVDSAHVRALLLHAQWQADEIERLKVRLDPYLDRAHGSPATVPVH